MLKVGGYMGIGYMFFFFVFHQIHFFQLYQYLLNVHFFLGIKKDMLHLNYCI